MYIAYCKQVVCERLSTTITYELHLHVCVTVILTQDLDSQVCCKAAKEQY